MKPVLENIIKNDTTCLSIEQMRLYVNNVVTPIEKKEIELHILDCELCSDALEGMQQNQKPHEFVAEVQELKSKINKYKKEKRKIIYSPFRLAIAACAFTLLFISVAAYFNLFVNTKFKDVADKLDNLKSEMSSIAINNGNKKDTITIIQNNITTSPNTAVSSDAYDASPISTIENKNDSIFEPNKTVSTFDLVNNEKTESPVADKGLAENITATDKLTESENEAVYKNINKSESAKDLANKTESETKKISSTTKVQATSTGTTTAAAPTAMASKADDLDNIKAKSKNATRMQLGIAAFKAEKYIDAIKLFDQIIAENDETYIDEALYNKAIAHYKIGDYVTSKYLLESIIAQGSKFAPSAKIQLAELEKLLK